MDERTEAAVPYERMSYEDLVRTVRAQDTIISNLHRITGGLEEEIQHLQEVLDVLRESNKELLERVRLGGELERSQEMLIGSYRKRTAELERQLGAAERMVEAQDDFVRVVAERNAALEGTIAGLFFRQREEAADAAWRARRPAQAA